MASVTSVGSDGSRIKRFQDFEDQSLPQSKRIRSDGKLSIPHCTRPKLLPKERESQSYQHFGETTELDPHVFTPARHLKEPRDVQLRIYVGNIPPHLRLPNVAYKELFSALYITAFGALKPGEISPVQRFWQHRCQKFGFLQMRGSREAVNILLFNGLTLHGRVIKLGRPSGYRLEAKNLSADAYVPDRIMCDRINFLVDSLGGIIAAPKEKPYLAATETEKGVHPGIEIIEKMSTAGSANLEQGVEVE